MALLCVLLQADSRTKTLSPYAKHTNQAEMCLSLIENLFITAIIKVPSYCSTRNKRDHSNTSDLTSTSRLLDILWYCFLNVAALLHCPLGSAPICGCIVLLPVADISTSWILLLHSPNITHWSTAHVSLFQAWKWFPHSSHKIIGQSGGSGNRRKLNCP